MNILAPPPANPTPAGVVSADFLASVLNASRDCIKVLNLDGELVFMNSGGMTVMEIDDFEVFRGCPWPSFWEGEHGVAAAEAIERAKSGHSTQFVGFAHTAKQSPRWWDVTVIPIAADGDRPAHILSMSRNITTSKLAEIERELLAGEIAHRARNLLAIVGAIAHQSFKGGDPAQIDAFHGRLAALGETQDVLLHKSDGSSNVRDVVEGSLAPQAAPDRVSAAGPDYQLTPKRSLALALAIHELATNALKYGAFSNDAGSVDVEWSIDNGRFTLSWTEDGGPAVAEPVRRGFGSRIIHQNLASAFDGEVTADFRPSGLLLRLNAPA